jgi:hypothetical protein
MKTIIFIIGLVLVISGLSIVMCNYAYLILNWINRRKGLDKFHSQIPLFGAVFLIVGIFFIPSNFNKYYSLILLLVDPGTLMLFWCIPYFAMKALKKN